MHEYIAQHDNWVTAEETLQDIPVRILHADQNTGCEMINLC